MFTLPNRTKVLNLPEQVELNKENIEANAAAIKENTDSISSDSLTIDNIKSDLTTIHDDINNITSPDGTITTGTLDVEKIATFGSNVEIDGGLTLNSPSDLHFKTGDTDYTDFNEFKKLYYAEEGIGKYAGIVLAPFENEWRLTDVKEFTNLDLLFSGATIVMEYNQDTFTMNDIGIAATSHIFYRAKAVDAGFRDTDWKIVMGNGTSTTAYWMFANVLDIKSITLAEGATFLVRNSAYQMFSSNPKLEEVGAFDLSGTADLGEIFLGDSSLKHIHIKHFKGSFNISASTQFETTDLVEIIGNLDQVTTARTLTMGAANLAKLTNDQILVATGKGWTLA